MRMTFRLRWLGHVLAVASLVAQVPAASAQKNPEADTAASRRPSLLYFRGKLDEVQREHARTGGAVHVTAILEEPGKEKRQVIRIRFTEPEKAPEFSGQTFSGSVRPVYPSWRYEDTASVAGIFVGFDEASDLVLLENVSLWFKYNLANKITYKEARVGGAKAWMKEYQRGKRPAVGEKVDVPVWLEVHRFSIDGGPVRGAGIPDGAGATTTARGAATTHAAPAPPTEFSLTGLVQSTSRGGVKVSGRWAYVEQGPRVEVGSVVATTYSFAPAPDPDNICETAWGVITGVKEGTVSFRPTKAGTISELLEAQKAGATVELERRDWPSGLREAPSIGSPTQLRLCRLVRKVSVVKSRPEPTPVPHVPFTRAGTEFRVDAERRPFQDAEPFAAVAAEVVRKYNVGLRDAKAQLDHSRAAKKTEFETTQAYLKRLAAYNDEVFRILDRHLRGSYEIDRIAFPAYGKTLKFNADRGTFSVWGDVWVGDIRWPSFSRDFAHIIPIPRNDDLANTPLWHKGDFDLGTAAETALPGLDFGAIPKGQFHKPNGVAAAQAFKEEVEAGAFFFRLKWEYDGLEPERTRQVGGGTAVFSDLGAYTGAVDIRHRLVEFTVRESRTGNVRFDLLGGRAGGR